MPTPDASLRAVTSVLVVLGRCGADLRTPASSFVVAIAPPAAAAAAASSLSSLAAAATRFVVAVYMNATTSAP